MHAVRTDFGVGGLRIRLEIPLITLGLAFLSGPWVALGFVLAVLTHELGHALARRALAGLGSGPSAPKVVLGVTGGSPYVRDVTDPRTKVLTLVAGPIASAVLALVALTAGAFIGRGAAATAAIYEAALVWTIYQLMPFPPLDGGLLLRLLLAGHVKSATLAWRLGWLLGSALAGLFVFLDPSSLQVVLLLTAVAVVLGRAESGYVRHLDAYALWERGEHRAVVALVSKVPEYLEKDDKTRLAELGVRSALELAEPALVAELAEALPSHHPIVLRAAEWLLGRDDAQGARLAQRALDALDAELVKPTPAERELFADLAFRFALFEVRDLRADSGIGLLERAVDLGFRDADRLEADGALAPFLDHPRVVRVLERARGAS